MTETPVHLPKRYKKPGIRAQRLADRRDLALRVAGDIFRTKGLASATMADIAAAMGVTKVVLYRRYPSKDALIEALFEEVSSAIKGQDAGPWQGYGSRLQAILRAVRSVEDGYVVLVRDSEFYGASRRYKEGLRAYTRALIQTTMQFPDPEATDNPLAARLCLETIVTLSHEALSWWVQHGSAERDPEFLSWFAYLVRSWREGAMAIFGLGNPDFEAPAGPVQVPPKP